MPRNPDAYQVTAEEVHDVVRDQQRLPHRTVSRELFAVDKYRIVEVILGKRPVNPSLIRPGFHGHVGRDAQINKVLSMSTLNRVLDQLVDEGVLVKVRKPNYSDQGNALTQRQARAVQFPYRTASGYVTKEALDERFERLDAEKRNRQRDEIMKAAVSAIAEKYARQVEATYRRICAERGLDAVKENVNGDTNLDDEEF